MTTLLALICLTAPQDPNDSIFLVDSNNNILVKGQKQHLIEGQVESLSVSDNGNWAFVTRRKLTETQYTNQLANKEPTSRLLFTLVNGHSKKYTDFPQLDEDKYTLESITVFDSGCAVAKLDTEESYHSITLVLTPQGHIKVLFQAPFDQLPRVFVSPVNGTENILIQTYTRENKADGTFIQHSNLQLLDSSGNIQKEWPNAYRELGAMTPYYDAGPGEVVFYGEDSTIIAFNPLTGNKRLVPKDIHTQQNKVQDQTIGLESRPIKGSGGEETPALYAVLLNPKSERSFNRVLIGTRLNGMAALKSPVAYVYDDAGLYRQPFTPSTHNAFAAWEKEQVKAQTIKRAKMIGTAMHIYMADHDDHFPPANTWQEDILPYTRMPELTEGFNYLLNGQDITNIEDIAGTILGIISTKYGDAVVYADSSVKWRDPPGK